MQRLHLNQIIQMILILRKQNQILLLFGMITHWNRVKMMMLLILGRRMMRILEFSYMFFTSFRQIQPPSVH